MTNDSSGAEVGPAAGYYSKDFPDFVSDLVKDWHVPGISIAVADGDLLIHKTQGFGMAELPSTPFCDSTVLYAGSTTKTHVSALLARLIASNKFRDDRDQPLSWKTPICSLIRDNFVLQDEWATHHITLEDALCHRTGLGRHDNAYIRYLRLDGFDGEKRLVTLRELVRNLRHLPMTSEPRTEYRYSSLMFVVLSHVIETLTGQRLEDALLTGLWKPLRMLDTYLSLQDALSKSWHVARGYAWDKDWEQYVPLDWMPTEEVSGSGAVIMSGPDMARWLRFWIREQKPLTPEAHRNIRHPRIVIQGEDPSPYDTPLMCAQAWNTSSYRGHRFWTKHGGTDAFGALITFFPELDFGIAIMGNTAYTANAVAEILTWHLVDNKLDVSPKERFDWTKRWKNAVKGIERKVRNGLNEIYPTRPEWPIRPTLQLSKYAGLYYHPEYKYLKLMTTDMTSATAGPGTELQAEQPDTKFRIKCDFVHVSGEKWIMYVDMKDAPTLTVYTFAAVEFWIGIDGEVESMGVEWRDGCEVDGWIWYKKIRAGGALSRA